MHSVPNLSGAGAVFGLQSSEGLLCLFSQLNRERFPFVKHSFFRRYVSCVFVFLCVCILLFFLSVALL